MKHEEIDALVAERRTLLERQFEIELKLSMYGVRVSERPEGSRWFAEHSFVPRASQLHEGRQGPGVQPVHQGHHGRVAWRTDGQSVPQLRLDRLAVTQRVFEVQRRLGLPAPSLEELDRIAESWAK